MNLEGLVDSLIEPACSGSKWKAKDEMNLTLNPWWTAVGTWERMGLRQGRRSGEDPSPLTRLPPSLPLYLLLQLCPVPSSTHHLPISPPSPALFLPLPPWFLYPFLCSYFNILLLLVSVTSSKLLVLSAELSGSPSWNTHNYFLNQRLSHLASLLSQHTLCNFLGLTR